MQHYKAKNDSIRVPDTLMNDTMQKMHARNDRLHQQAASSVLAELKMVLQWYQRPAARIVAIAACVCLLLTAALTWYLPANVPMATLSADPSDAYRPSGLPEIGTTSKSMDIGDYSAYTGISYRELLHEYTINTADAEVLFDADRNALSDHAFFRYRHDSHEIQLTVTTEAVPAMDELLSAEPLSLDAIQLRFGHVADSDKYCAAWAVDGRTYYMQSDTMTRRAFVLAAKEAARYCASALA